MTEGKLEACTRGDLAEMARKKGISGWHVMRKGDLIAALSGSSRPRLAARRSRPARKSPVRKLQPKRMPVQTAVARDTSAASSGEEQVERSKFEVGVATKDLSAKVPKDLPSGYGK